MFSIMHLSYTKSMRENNGGDRGYLSLANVRLQSEFLRSNFSIQRVPRVGVEKETEKVEK